MQGETPTSIPQLPTSTSWIPAPDFRLPEPEFQLPASGSRKLEAGLEELSLDRLLPCPFYCSSVSSFLLPLYFVLRPSFLCPLSTSLLPLPPSSSLLPSFLFFRTPSGEATRAPGLCGCLVSVTPLYGLVGCRLVGCRLPSLLAVWLFVRLSFAQFAGRAGCRRLGPSLPLFRLRLWLSAAWSFFFLVCFSVLVVLVLFPFALVLAFLAFFLAFFFAWLFRLGFGSVFRPPFWPSWLFLAPFLAWPFCLLVVGCLVAGPFAPCVAWFGGLVACLLVCWFVGLVARW